MAEDVRLYADFFRHPKTALLERLLGVEGPYRALQLIAAVADSYPEGSLVGKTDPFIEALAGWTGTGGAFVLAMSQAGFIDGAEMNRGMHNWAKRQPWVVDRPRRQAQGLQAIQKRWDKKRHNRNRTDDLEIARSKGAHAEEEWRELVSIYGHVCARCSGDPPITKDHIVPISWRDDPRASDSIENLQPLCSRCNSQKGGKTDEDQIASDLLRRPPNWERILHESLAAKYSQYSRSNTPSRQPIEAKPKTRTLELRRPVQNTAVGQ